ncbi:MAG: hypothetical protein HKN47_18425, partial [Pirellulaceae bacterium]|nr:hypothetical protein [Pirellulaceae bacterium]
VLQSGGNNIDSGDTSGFNQPTDQLNSDPLLADLFDNGGPVPTHAIAFGSPAIDRGGDIGPATDARGATRPFDGDDDGNVLFDVGAFESNQAAFIGALTVEDLTVNEDAGVATFTVTLDRDTPAFTVDVRTVDGSAIAPDDYDDTQVTLSFGGIAGEQQTVDIGVNDDDVVEGLENLVIELLNASNNQIDARDTAQLFLTDNDTATLTIDDITVGEDVGTAVVSVMVDKAVDGGFTVNFATSDGTAVEPDDYTSAGGILTFAGDAGEIQTFNVTIIDDDDLEGAEQFNVGLFSVSNPDVNDLDTSVVNINDNDVAQLSIDDVTVNEADGTAMLTVTLNRNIVGGFTVDAFTADDTAIAPGDYSDTVQTLSFNGVAGETETILVPVNNDADLVEETESFTVSFRNASDGRVDVTDSATVTINDDDMATLSINDVSNLSGVISFSITLDSDVDAPLTVDVATMDIPGQAVAGDDYQPNAETLTFQGNAGETQSFDVFVEPDAIVEPDETYQAILSNLQAGSRDVQILRGTGTGTIVDDDSATITIDDVTEAEDTGPATVTIRLNGAVQDGFTIDFATIDGTAVSPDDYAAAGGTLNFDGTANEFKTVDISLVNDFLVEPNETFTFNVSNLITLGANPAPVVAIDATDNATVTITDPLVTDVDLAVAIQESQDPIRTGDPIQYTVSLTNNAVIPATGMNWVTTVPQPLNIQTVTAPAGAVVDVSGGVITVDLSQLNPLQSVDLTIDAVAGNTPGIVTVSSNVSSVEDDTDPANNTASEQTTIDQANGIAGRVFCDANNSGDHDPGEEVVDTLVFIDQNLNSSFDVGEENTRSDFEGRYQFADIVGTNLQVSVAVPPSCNTIPDRPSVNRLVMPVGDVARAITSVDLGNDGDLDLVVSADFSNSLTVLENTNNGFVRLMDIALGDRPQSVFAYQPQGSLEPTIAVAGIGTPDNGGAVWVTNGSGPAVRHPGTNGPIDAIVGDFNDDGLPDILSASFRSPQLDLRMGGSLQSQIIDSQSQQILSIAAGDLIGTDSGHEVVVSGFGHGNATQLELYDFDAAGGLTKVHSIATPSSTVEVAVANVIEDVNGETNEIVTLLASGQIVVYPVNGSTIGNGVTTSVRRDASAFDFGDFNQDGITDVAVANLGGQLIELLVGTGDGRFVLITTVRNVSAPSDLVVGDFNQDG